MSFIFFFVLIVGSLSRLINHPPNFAAIGAMGIFCGLYAQNNKQAFFLPISARLITDSMLGFFSFPVMVSVYLATAAGSALGIWAKKNKKITTVVFAAVISSIIFFLATNAAVWKFQNLYSHDIKGLGQSYLAAMPFFRNSLLGNLFYVTLLVGGYETAQKIINTIRTKRSVKYAKNRIN